MPKVPFVGRHIGSRIEAAHISSMLHNSPETLHKVTVTCLALKQAGPSMVPMRDYSFWLISGASTNLQTCFEHQSDGDKSTHHKDTEC